MTTILTGKRLKFAQRLLAGDTQLEAYRRAGYVPRTGAACRTANTPAVVEWLAEQRAKQDRLDELRAANAPPPPPPDPAEPEHVTMARDLFKMAKSRNDLRGMSAALAAMTPKPEPRSPGRKRKDGNPAQWRDQPDQPDNPTTRYEIREPTKQDLDAIRREFRNQYGMDHARTIWDQREETAAHAAETLQRALEARQRCMEAPEPDPEADEEDNLETVTREEKDQLRRMTDAEVVEWWINPPDCLFDAAPTPNPADQRATAEAVLDRVLRDRL
jgi:hypothetical protein